MNKISIIVPVYNLELYLEKCVKSICDQTYTNLEIILVDDGSTDMSLSVAKKLASEDERIQVYTQENGGVTKARLAGVSHASGEWIGFIDGDDYIEPNMYEVLLNNALKYHADISHCGYQMVFPNRTDYYYNTGKIVVQDSESGVKDLLEGTFIEPGLVNKLYKKELLLDLIASQKMDLSIKNLEDLLMNYYLFKNATCSVFEDRCFYFYMVRKNSAATGKINENKLRDPLRVFETIQEDCRDDLQLQHILTERIANQLVNLATIDTEGSSMIADYKKKARKKLKKIRKSILYGSYTRRLKYMVFGASLMPNCYRLLHKIYAKLSGTAKKYAVE